MAEMNNIEMRKAYCNKLIELAEKDPRVVVLEADLMKASGTSPFKERFPDRGIDVGIAESNMVGIASGLCLKGFIPFAASFGCFAGRRAFDQFFVSSNYARLNVKLVGTDPGVTAAYNGGTHMPFEDIGMMRMIPSLVIAEPSDAVSAAAYTQLMYEHQGCCYMRLHRKALDPIYGQDEKFELGKAKVLREGKDATIAALGGLEVHEALKAADMLEKKGVQVSVIDMLTVRPLDTDLILSEIEKKHVLVTAENAQVAGGLGAEVANLIALNGLSCKFGMIGVQNRFGQVGKVDYLAREYGLTAEDISGLVLKLL